MTGPGLLPPATPDTRCILPDAAVAHRAGDGRDAYDHAVPTADAVKLEPRIAEAGRIESLGRRHTALDVTLDPSDDAGTGAVTPEACDVQPSSAA